MLTSEERDLVYDYAYLPEHLPDYVGSVTGGEPYLEGGHLCFLRKDHLAFIGYALGTDALETREAYESACRRFKPATVAFIASEIRLPNDTCEPLGTDHYYRLDLPASPPPPEVAYMVRRAGRELAVGPGTFGREHGKLVKAFLSEHALGSEQRHICKQIPHYLKRSDSACLIEARKGRTLVAFSIVDTGARDYAFYMFSFRSSRQTVPGASDLIFSEMIRTAHSKGRKTLNLGLGINPGIRRFKEKWGGKVFLPYASALVRRQTMDLGRLADKL